MAHVVIPAEIDGHPVTAIGGGTFSHYKSLTSVNIPDSVIPIGNDAFMFCPNLRLTVIPGSYGEAYAKENGIALRYAEDLDK